MLSTHHSMTSVSLGTNQSRISMYDRHWSSMTCVHCKNKKIFRWYTKYIAYTKCINYNISTHIAHESFEHFCFWTMAVNKDSSQSLSNRLASLSRMFFFASLNTFLMQAASAFFNNGSQPESPEHCGLQFLLMQFVLIFAISERNSSACPGLHDWKIIWEN